MKVKVGDQEVVLDPKHLEVSEVSMNDFLKNFAALYSYYNAMWAKSQFIQHLTEDKYDQVASERFQHYKESEGGSDKLVEAKVTVSEKVIAARRAAREAKYICQLLFTYLRALDKAHENALNLGYNIRKEIDKIYPQHIHGEADGLDKDGLPMDVDKQVEKLVAGEL